MAESEKKLSLLTIKEILLLPEGAVAQIVTKTRQHHTNSVCLICTSRLDPDQVVHQLTRKVHNPQ